MLNPHSRSCPPDSAPTLDPGTPPALGHDEEGDLPTFQAYLHDLSPDELWDIKGHVDSDRFPRRGEAVEREIARRKLFYVVPYTRIEAKLRDRAGITGAFCVLAAVLRAVADMPLPKLAPWERLPWFYDLAYGGPGAAHIALPVARLLAGGLLLLLLCGTVPALRQWVRGRRFRGDALVAALVALAVGGGLLAWAWRWG